MASSISARSASTLFGTLPALVATTGALGCTPRPDRCPTPAQSDAAARGGQDSAGFGGQVAAAGTRAESVQGGVGGESSPGNIGGSSAGAGGNGGRAAAGTGTAGILEPDRVSDGGGAGTSPTPESRCEPRTWDLDGDGKFADPISLVDSLSCVREPGNEFSMSFSVEQGQYELCVLSVGFEPVPFFVDGSGVLEVTFCADRNTHGDLRLWYGKHPWRKSILLVANHETMPSGCTTKYFAPDVACFAGWDALETPDADCRDSCGAQGDVCPVDLSTPELTLAVEWSAQPIAGQVRVVSLRYYPSDCSCGAGRPCSNAPASCHTGVLTQETEPPPQGVCVSPALNTPCSGLVGRFQEGLKRSTDAFREAQALLSPRIGCPGCPNACNPYVHYEQGIAIQDYYQPALDQSYSSDGRTALVYNQDLDQAILVSGMFWAVYKCLTTSQVDMAGPVLLGAPTTDSYESGNHVRQDYQLGYVDWTPPWADDPERVDVYLEQGAADADLSENCKELADKVSL